MEVELGLKITRTLDDPVSADFRLAKDRAGPLFLSTETDSSFILTAYLKGFKREQIKISINEDGTQLTISGSKPIQEFVMTGRGVYKKEPEMRGFMKVFIIPEGVVLNQIKAKFNEEESVLKISMPKLNKGITGASIDEVKEELPAPEKRPGGFNDVSPMKASLLEEGSQEDEVQKESSGIEGYEPEEEGMPPSKKLKTEGTKVGNDGETAEIGGPESEIREAGTDQAIEEEHRQENGTSEETVSKKQVEKTSRLFSPCFFMGSALLASIVVLVVSFIRSKSKRR